jgi:hypothetical protein
MERFTCGTKLSVMQPPEQVKKGTETLACPVVAGPHADIRRIIHVYVRGCTMKGIRPLLFVATLTACGGGDSSLTGVTPTPTPAGFRSNPCSPAGTLQLTSAQSARIDCSAGGTTVTLAGAGASYLIVPQFATDQGNDNGVQFNLASGTIASSSLSPVVDAHLLRAADAGTLPPIRPMLAQRSAERVLRARAKARGIPTSLASLLTQQHVLRSELPPAPPALGSKRMFHVASSFTSFQYKDIGAVLSYAGNNILIYVDTLAPTNGFTPAQFASFGTLFDQTLYPIDTLAFGGPADLDGNGRVIIVMSPTVNADTPAATCNTQGFVAGFFDPSDFDGPGDPYSNQGEVFYTIVPDPAGIFSCAHNPDELGADVPATFLHELQHLINFSQHVVVSGTGEGASWMDEGLSIIAEELGSIYYEQKCPPPQCRTSPAQLFPDSAQGFISSFLYDSYQYALAPDTSSITLHDDSEDGFSWRGGTWLLMRWLGDQFGTATYRKLVRGPAGGVADIELATGQPFGTVLANFGLSLYTDSLAGLPRATSGTTNRFLSRNVKALWARLYATSGGASDIPRAQPLVVTPMSGDTLTLSRIRPGAMKFYRLDTPAGQSTVTIRFATPGGTALAGSLKPQLAIYRLPSGQ